MADSVGTIGLDLVVNKNDFVQQMNGIQALAKKAGAALAGAFAIKKLVDFSKSCIQLGSDLAEVQNVVDVTFPHMASQIDDFAKRAAASYGLSETMAKKYTGSFGAMAKAFGFTERQAYEMGTTLTGLSGDVASFYNISQDEAYTKLKSVFSGETETLKDLGIVMTQSALDAYALANGYGKTTANMSELEKVALRYSFVQDQLNAAAGDFSRTSGSWANQVRLLQLQFDSLRATIGQGLIAALLPVIQVLNALIGKLISAANAIKAFFALLGGGGKGGVKAMASGTKELSSGADGLSKSLGGAGNAAKGAGGAAKKAGDAAKQLAKGTLGIDELNIVEPNKSSGGGSGGSGGGGGAGGGYAADDFDMGSIDEGADAASSKIQGIIDRLNELKGIFTAGFWQGFGDTSVFDSIQDNISRIGKSLKEIFTDPGVQAATNECANKITYAFGKVVGSMASIGATIVDNLTGAIANYLEQNNPRIKQYLIKVFDISGDVALLKGNYAQAFAEIFAVLRNDTFKQIGADIIGIFADTFMGISLLLLQFDADLTNLLLTPIIENKNAIIATLEELAVPIEQFFGDVKAIIDQLFEMLNALYDEHFHPLMESITSGISDIVSTVLSAFNTYLMPVIQNTADKFTSFKDSSLAPLISKFGEFAGAVIDDVTQVWNGILIPLIEWLINTLVPAVAGVIDTVTTVIFQLLTDISGVISSVLTLLQGVIDFLTGVFTGDWDKAWTGIKEIFRGIWEIIKSILRLALDIITSAIKTTLANIKALWTVIWTAIKDFFRQIWDAIRSLVTTAIEAVRTTISTAMDLIKFNIDTVLTNIKSAWETGWNAVKDLTKAVWDGIWGIIKGTINSILGGVETMVNGVVRGINRMIEALNSIDIDIPDWVPGIGGNSFSINIPTVPEVSLPRLANGGFVRANTPQLAVIGDNRRQGEIVSPEDKLQAMADRAAGLARNSDGMSAEQANRLIELMEMILSAIEAMHLTVNLDSRELQDGLDRLRSRSGLVLKTS
jgi:phage-related protein